MRGIITAAGYVPHHRLDRSEITTFFGSGGGNGTRSVASYDEDTTTLAVEAGRLALRDAPATASPRSLWFSTSTPTYLEKTNATIIHAALRLDRDAPAFDLGGAVRSGIGSLRNALSSAESATLVTAADIRTGNPTSADETAGGDAATALLIGDDSAGPVIAELIASASATQEFLDTWRIPGEAATRHWEDRFAQTEYTPLAADAWRDALKAAALGSGTVDTLIIAGGHGRAVKAITKKLAGDAETVAPGLDGTVGFTGATDAATVKDHLRALLLELVDPTMDRSLAASPVLGDDGQPHPATILMVGVNGTGKTTTAGKLARILVADDKDVVLGAADTFRAAAADQLQTWGERAGVPVVRSDREGADPASVAFEAVKTGRESGADVVIIDTAGRLQNKAGLMDELGKLKRVVGRGAPISEVLLVLDATTGQNGMRQAQVFAEVADVSGIVLTKLDGTAKGGIVIAVQRELGMPVKFVGLGEGPDDLAPFSAEDFVDAILD